MPRELRLQEGGASYHVYTRGNRSAAIYLDDADRAKCLDLLRRVVVKRAWICHAYCLMPNHFHLLVTTPEPDIAAGMQALKSRYAEHFNHRYELRGHLFEGRYGSVVMKSDDHLLVAFRYVARNPIRAGYCLRPEEFPWSSYRFTLGLDPAPDFLAPQPVLEAMSPHVDVARQRLRRFVDEAHGEQAQLREAVSNRHRQQFEGLTPGLTARGARATRARPHARARDRRPRV